MSDSNNDPLRPAHPCQADTGDAGLRLDRFVTDRLPGATRSEAQRLIEMPGDHTGGVHVNGHREKPSYRMRAGDSVDILRPPPEPTHLIAQDLPLEIVFEDADLIVINKSRGMVVHPSPGWESGTVANAVLAHADDLSGIGGEMRPGIVHRLDRDTGGLLIIAKNDAAHRDLQRQIQEKTAARRYMAIVWGVPSFETATIDAAIGRHPADRKKMAVITDPHHGSRPARTGLHRQETFSGAFSLLQATLSTGRTHQIRVHCAFIAHPIVGDPTYGGIRKVPAGPFGAAQRNAIEEAIQGLGGQALHAYSLAFDHPKSGERLAFKVPLPEPMQRLLDSLR